MDTHKILYTPSKAERFQHMCLIELNPEHYWQGTIVECSCGKQYVNGFNSDWRLVWKRKRFKYKGAIAAGVAEKALLDTYRAPKK